MPPWLNVDPITLTLGFLHTLVLPILHQKQFLHHPLLSIPVTDALALTNPSCLDHGSCLLLSVLTSSLTPSRGSASELPPL